MLGKDSNLQRAICHLAHIFLKDGSRIHCDFMNRTEPPILSSETRCREMMGQESARKAFFREYAPLRWRHDSAAS